MNIAIITGGRGGEKEVSIMSAKNIQELLSIPDKYFFNYPQDIEKVEKLKSQIDICIPMIHGLDGEDGHIQLKLEKMNIPYLFSSPLVHKAALDKRKTKSILSDIGIRSPQEFDGINNIKGTVFIKPINGGSSLLNIKTSSINEIQDFVEKHKNNNFIIEESLEGREFSVGVIETSSGIKALPVVEIKTKRDFFDYESKYNEEELAQEICPANISQELKNNLKELALSAHKEIGCKHLSRSDFIVTSSGVYFLEINTIPGMTNTSLILKALEAESISLKELFLYWINQNKFK